MLYTVKDTKNANAILGTSHLTHFKKHIKIRRSIKRKIQFAKTQ